MKIAIRKELNGGIYIDKTALNRFDEKTLKQPPYNYSFVEVDEKDCESSDFNDDLTFNLDKYNARKQLKLNTQYEELIIAKIREKYTINQELAILRQRDSKPEEFSEYNTYAENCKAQVKNMLDKLEK